MSRSPDRTTASCGHADRTSTGGYQLDGTLLDAPGAGAGGADQSRADPSRAAATAARRSVVVPACVVHQRTCSRLVGRRASGHRAVAGSRSQAHGARATGKDGVRTRLCPVPRRPRTIDATGDAQRSAGAGDSVPQHLQPVSTPRRPDRRDTSSRRVRRSSLAMYAPTRSRCRWRHRAPGGPRFRPGTIVRRTSSDPGRALLTGFVGGPAPRDDWEKFDVPGLRGISKTAPYFINNSAATLEEMVDHYVALFKRAEVNFVPGPTRCRAPDRDDRRRELRSTAGARRARRAPCVPEKAVDELAEALLRRAGRSGRRRSSGACGRRRGISRQG